ncbi:hypothetical protein [Pandoravirus japonicus]|uniref:Uncharacterized protein n=1 Tax=Pandoravirus japonicus TaxID=2823154 RepID=A0A811BS87_9VIRU|nr:hypothetical protein [Pandoravirus japonicus]
MMLAAVLCLVLPLRAVLARAHVAHAGIPSNRQSGARFKKMWKNVTTHKRRANRLPQFWRAQTRAEPLAVAVLVLSKRIRFWGVSVPFFCCI